MSACLRFCRDDSGQTTVEWALLLGCFGAPMLVVLGWLLEALAETYRMTTFFEALPFP